MDHKENGAHEIDKSLHTAFHESLLANQFFEFEDVGDEVEDDVEFGYGLEGHFEFEEKLLEASQPWVNCVSTDT